MTAVKSVVKPGIYRDSIFLMKLSAEAARGSGADAVSAMMATERNKDLFTASGLMTPEIRAANPGDLAIAIKGSDEAADRAVAEVMRLLDAAPEAPASSDPAGHVQARAGTGRPAACSGPCSRARADRPAARTRARGPRGRVRRHHGADPLHLSQMQNPGHAGG